MKASSQYGRFGSGHAVRRVEDEGLLTGRGNFADDVNASGQAQVVFLRSTHPHARIAGIDTNTAAKMPGVIAIVTGAGSGIGREISFKLGEAGARVVVSDINGSRTSRSSSVMCSAWARRPGSSCCTAERDRHG